MHQLPKLDNELEMTKLCFSNIPAWQQLCIRREELRPEFHTGIRILEDQLAYTKNKTKISLEENMLVLLEYCLTDVIH